MPRQGGQRCRTSDTPDPKRSTLHETGVSPAILHQDGSSGPASEGSMDRISGHKSARRPGAGGPTGGGRSGNHCLVAHSPSAAPHGVMGGRFIRTAARPGNCLQYRMPHPAPSHSTSLRRASARPDRRVYRRKRARDDSLPDQRDGAQLERRVRPQRDDGSPLRAVPDGPASERATASGKETCPERSLSEQVWSAVALLPLMVPGTRQAAAVQQRRRRQTSQRSRARRHLTLPRTPSARCIRSRLLSLSALPH